VEATVKRHLDGLDPEELKEIEDESKERSKP
jgi:hypothetical protein